MSRIAWLLPLSLGLLIACDGADPTASDPHRAAALADEIATEATFTIDIQPVALLYPAKVDQNVFLLDRPFVTVAALPVGGFDVTQLTAANVYLAKAGTTAPQFFEVHVEATDNDCDYVAKHYRDLDANGTLDLALFHFGTDGMEALAGESWCLNWNGGEYCAVLDAVKGGS